MSKKRFGLSVVLAVFVALVPVAGVLADGQVDGEFTIPSAPRDLGVSPDASMTPQQQAEIDVTVTDYDGMSDIAQIEVVFYYSAAGSANGAPLSLSVDAQNVAKMVWDASSDWSLTPAGTTWSLVNGSCSTPTLDAATTTGTWTFAFKPGKVATRTNGSAAWRAFAKVTSVTDSETVEGTGSQLVAMNHYQEITITAGGSVDWGNVIPNSDYAANQVTGIGVNYIANGDYTATVMSDASWNTAALGADPANLGDNEFALKANEDTTLVSAVQVDAVGVALNSAGVQTSESGVTESDNTLWLKLGPTFDVGDYAGHITYMVANR